MRRFLAFFVAAAMIALVGSGCSSSGGGPVATVRPDAAAISFVTKGTTKNEDVTRDSLLNEVGKIVANKPFATWLKQNNFAVNANISTDTKVSAIWLTQLIHQEAIDEIFVAKHLTVTPAIKTSSAKDVAGIFPTADIYPAFDAKFRAVLTERQERTEAVLGSYTDTSDAAGQAYYNAHASQFACKSGKNVAHILVATQAAAQAVLDQLHTGASFAALAAKDSTDTQSGAQGGNLGCITAGEFVPAFQTAADAAPIGTPIGPVHSQFGYHVILVTKAANSYAASRSQVLTVLAQQGQSTAQAAIDALLKAAKVHLDPRFGKWGFVTNSQGQGVWQVTAPTPPTPSSSREGTTTTASPTTLPTAAPGAAGNAVMAGKPRVVVVGLGPAGADLLLPAARAALERVPIRFVRTARHPAVDDLAREGIDLEPLDLLYDRADDLDTVYAAIADRVVETARERGEILYAVPGSPTIAERSVELVRAAGIDVELIPGISFVDLAWWRLGIDPMHGARVVDARAFAIDAAGSSGAMLIAECDSQMVCSEVKLALLESLPADHEVTVLQRLGLPDEHVFTVALADVDRDVEPDHLTSLFVDTGAAAVGPELVRLLALTEQLRGPGGCPWDAAQTHHTLRRHVLEEAYEVVEAIEQLPADAPAGDIPIGAYDALEDELGDLLFQVMIQSVLASEAGAFTVADVASAVHTKLVRRHPHVFGDVQVSDANEVVTNWEQIKKTEKDDQSLVAGVTAGLPSLIAAQKLFRKGSSIGLEPDVELAEAVRGLDDAEAPDFEAKLGAALVAVVAIGREHDIDAESALAGWTRRYKEQFRRMEQLAADANVDLAKSPAAEVRGLWERAARH